jgi:hypothetical protein
MSNWTEPTVAWIFHSSLDTTRYVLGSAGAQHILPNLNRIWIPNRVGSFVLILIGVSGSAVFMSFTNFAAVWFCGTYCFDRAAAVGPRESAAICDSAHLKNWLLAMSLLCWERYNTLFSRAFCRNLGIEARCSSCFVMAIYKFCNPSRVWWWTCQSSKREPNPNGTGERRGEWEELCMRVGTMLLSDLSRTKVWERGCGHECEHSNNEGQHWVPQGTNTKGKLIVCFVFMYTMYIL